MLDALGRTISKRPLRIIAIASVLFVVAAVLGGGVADRLTPYAADDPATESVKAKDGVEAATGEEPGPSLIALVNLDSKVGSARARKQVREVRALITGDPAVTRVASYYSTRDPAMVSRDERSTYLAAYFKAAPDDQIQDSAEALGHRLESVGVKAGGSGVAQAQINEQTEADLRRAELIAFPFLFLLSFLFFRGLVAALLPPLVGLLAILGTFVALRFYAEFTDVSVFALNLTTALGLGLAIDYSLFIVSRYREELAKHGPGAHALRVTLNTAGRTVLFSSLTVAAALASLLVFPQNFLYSMGLGGMTVALIAAIVALTVLPAILALLGPRVNALSPKRLQQAAERDSRPLSSGFWYRLSRTVMRQPGAVALGTAALLVAMGLPFLGIKFTSVDPSVLPASASAHQVDAEMNRDFAANSTSTDLLVHSTDPEQVSAVVRKARQTDNVTLVSPPRRIDDGLTEIAVRSRYGPLDDRSRAIVTDLRATEFPAAVQVGGYTSEFIDVKKSIADHLPLAAVIVFGSTMLVLFLMTGSVVLPIKAALMNILSLSAAFGLLVLIFQDGRFETLLDYRGMGALEVTQPVVLFAVAFGLSTDYGVFLLSRIKEARDAGASDSDAVAIGLERTGRIVTAAALLFCVAMGAFATSSIIFVKELGVGTALAVLIDASLVRALLVPALMELLGKWNWWAPRPLRRIHERFGLSESGAQPA